LAELLADNTILKSLTVKIFHTINLVFLEYAKQLTAFTFLGQFTFMSDHNGIILYPGAVDPLFEFIRTHSTLTTLTLEVPKNHEPMSRLNFQEFYARLVSAILEGNSVVVLTLIFAVEVDGEKADFIQWIANASKPLVGRGMILNGVDLDQMVRDFLNFSLGDQVFEDENCVYLGMIRK